MLKIKRKLGRSYPVKRNKYLTLMISTNPTKQPKTLRIPKWMQFPVYLVVIGIALLVVMSGRRVADVELRMALRTSEMKSILLENQEKDARIKELEEENAKQYVRLEEIINQANQLQAEVEGLSEHKEIIDEKLNGVEKSTDQQVGEPLQIEATRVATANTLTQAHLSTGQNQQEVFEFDDKVALLEHNLKGLTSQVSTEKTVYEQIDMKVEETLPFWEAYPSVLPINSSITSNFGWRRNPFGGSSYELHKGVDLAANYGTSVKATGKGTVIYAAYDGVYGRMILVDHGYGLMTRYAHNSELLVSVGDVVERGQVIAKSGSTGRSTGPHLHYEVIQNGDPQDPLDYVYRGDDEE